MSGCKPRATDFSIAAIMSRGSAAAAAAAAAASGLRRAASPGLPPLGELFIHYGTVHSCRLSRPRNAAPIQHQYLPRVRGGAPPP